jgi:hypothetical protein
VAQIAFAKEKKDIAPPPQQTPDEFRLAENKRLRESTPLQLHREIRASHKYIEPTIELGFNAKQFKQTDARTIRAIISYPNGADRPGVRQAINLMLRNAAAAAAVGEGE